MKYIKGNLFDSSAPILGHACNCFGSWGAGVAAVFYKRFPQSFEVYREHCRKTPAAQLLGTTLLIEPENGQRVACLFTSDMAGRKKLPPHEIVRYTDLAMADLVRQTQGVELSIPKINAGLFAVPWEETERVLQKYDGQLDITVYEL